jgi:endonuclease III-like uncharacterized protein
MTNSSNTKDTPEKGTGKLPPPKDRDSLDSIIQDMLVQYTAWVNGEPVKWNVKKEEAKAAIRHLSTEEMLELIGPDGEHEKHCDFFKHYDNPEHVYCSCDKEPQDRLRAELRAALTREEPQQ